MKLLFSILFAIIILIFPAYATPPAFQADAEIKVASVIVPNNVTPITIKKNINGQVAGGTVYSIDGFNNSTTLAYVKLYNASTLSACGTGTPQARYMIPYGVSNSGGGFSIPNINGDSYALGIIMCVTLGIADTDTSSPAANTYIVNVHYH